MLKVSDFYADSASEQWFTTPSRKNGSLHDQLQARGFTLIDRPTLESDYQNLVAPLETVDLSYAESIPTPTPGYKSAFFTGYAFEIRKNKFKDRLISDVLNEWLNTTLGDEKYLISLFPKSYLVTKARTIEFDDIFNITRAWDLDCFIGVFDRTGKTMFVFSQEFALVHVSFDPNNIPAEFDNVSELFDNAGFVNDVVGRGGNRERIEEYYKTVVKPFIQ